MAVATSPWAWRLKFPALAWIRIASVVVGIGFVLYLVYTELFTLDAICLWCTSVHVLTFLLFVLIVAGAAAGYGFRERDYPDRSASRSWLAQRPAGGLRSAPPRPPRRPG